MKRPLAAIAGFTLAALIGVAGCSSDEPGGTYVTDPDEYQGICVDPDTKQRIPEERCGEYRSDGSNPLGYYWLWYLIGSRQARTLPGYGYPVPAGGYPSTPPGARTVPYSRPTVKPRPGYRPPAPTSKPKSTTRPTMPTTRQTAPAKPPRYVPPPVRQPPKVQAPPAPKPYNPPKFNPPKVRTR